MKVYSFFKINAIVTLDGLLYYYIFNNIQIFTTIFIMTNNYIFLKYFDYFNDKKINISDKTKYIPNNIVILQDLFKASIIELISIIICKKKLVYNPTYELITFIPRTFIFELIFDFFHYWTHRISHNKYLYIFHKKHHKQTNNISIFSTFNHSFFDLVFTNVIPMYLTSLIINLSEMQFFMFLIFKSIIEISGHSGVYAKDCSFIQCMWIPKLLGIELNIRDHYIHHAKFNYNYAKRFSLWDKTFGTYYQDNKMIEKENVLFNKNSIAINNEYIRYGLFFLLSIIGYLY